MSDWTCGPCPNCGSHSVTASLDCHTYPQGDKWMACLGCASAMRFGCGDCDWWYMWGGNPRNPRFRNNEERKPSWLEGEYPW